MRAGVETLRQLEEPGFYQDLESKAKALADGLGRCIAGAGAGASVSAFGSLLTLFFRKSPPANYAEAKESNTGQFAAFFNEMLKRGILLPPSQFEAWFVSAAHSREDVDRTIEACRDSLQALRGT